MVKNHIHLFAIIYNPYTLMKFSVILSTWSLLVVSSGLEIKTCADMKTVFDRANLEDTHATMYPFANILCDNFTTFTLSNYMLNISSTDNLDNFYGDSNLHNVRLEVVDGGKLTWETRIDFRNKDSEIKLHNVSGGAVYVGQGSSVSFLNGFKTTNIGVRSMTDESSDFSSEILEGGCVYNNGDFRVDGPTNMVNCESSGGGESGAGDGGAFYNDVNGTIILNGTVAISDVSITDDEGGKGGAFYNLGKVTINGDSDFTNLFAESAGAIYNGEGSVFRFKNGATAVFNNVRASDGISGGIVNNGVFKFSGPALFLKASSDYRASSIYVGSTGLLKMKKDTVFFKNTCSEPNCSTVYVATGGSLKFHKNVKFIGSSSRYGEIVCEGIFFEEYSKCET